MTTFKMLSPILIIYQLELCTLVKPLNVMGTIPNITENNYNIIGSLVGNSLLEEKRLVTVLFSNSSDRIDLCLRSIYEKTVFAVRLIGRLDDERYETMTAEPEWFLVIGDDPDNDDAWWKRAVAEIYTRGPYRPTVVIWFDQSLTIAVRYQILQVTWHDYWLHKTIITYPTECNRLRNGNCVVLTAAKNSEQIDSETSIVSLLADENNLTSAIRSIKDAQLEFETDFNGKELKTAVFLKRNYIEMVQLPGNKTELVGIDIEAMNTICAQLNLTPVIQVVGRGSVYMDHLNASLLSLDKRNESFLLNRYFNSPSLKEYILPVSVDSFYFIVQRRYTRNHFWKIFYGLKPAVWVMVGVTFVVVAITWRFLLAGSTLSLVQAALSTSHVELHHTRQRLVWISWLLFVLLIVNSLNGTIVTQLTTPVRDHKIKTLQKLLDTNMSLYTEVRGFTNERHDPVVTALTAKLIDINLQRPTADEIGHLAFLTSSNTRSILRQVNKNSDHFYTLPEGMDQLSTGYLMSPRNPAFDTFQRTISRLLETGYYEKWTHDYVNNVTQNTNKNTKRYYVYDLYNVTRGRLVRTSAVSLRELMLAFRLYCIGILSASVAFLAEIFIDKHERHNRRKRCERKRKIRLNRLTVLKN